MEAAPANAGAPLKPRCESRLPSIERLRELIEYNPQTGSLKWKYRADSEFSGKYPAERLANFWNKKFAGQECGCDNGSGYIVTRINGMSIKAHRIAFAIFHGRWPGEMVDHINGDKADNRIENLREATRSQNLQNQRRRRGSSRFKGVTWHSAANKWHAQIRLNKQNHRLGYFEDERKAAEAYDMAAREKFGGFARLNFPAKGVSA